MNCMYGAALLAFASFIFVAGCSKAPSDATVSLPPDVARRENDASSPIKQARDQREVVKAAIDRDFPGTKPPHKAPQSYRVKSIAESGVVELDGHPPVKLEGVVCSPSGIASIRTMLLDPATKLAPYSEDASAKSPVLWMVQEMHIDGRIDVSYVQIVEAALTSGWCSSLRAGQEGYNPRYEALEEFGKKFSN